MLMPFLAFLIQAIAGKKSTSGNIALLAIVISTVLSIFVVFTQVWNNEPLVQQFNWFIVGEKSFKVGVLLNNLTVFMQLIVCIVALPVHIYSRAYMKGDPGIHRYWMYLSLFCFAMLGLTISTNLLQLYIFWELVGFASYLLIGFWFTKESAAQANKKAFIINRIGDIGFLIGIALVYANMGTIDLIELFHKSEFFARSVQIDGVIQAVDKDATWITFAGLAFFLGAMAKSAQFPLHVWLPDAMEGPTAVSSLIHAATMVAAGVFLLCTVFPLFNETVLLVITVVGTITAASAAIFALGQYDIKKVLAFSTISQLGFMMVAVGIGAWDSAMFHLATHAFFKCLLFLSAGAVIHEMAHFKEHSHLDFDPQDMRNMGGLRRYMPKTFVCMTIASLALAGFPLTSGYLSKDSIIINAFEWGIFNGGLYLAIPAILILVSILTAFYIGRLIFKTFFGSFAFLEKTNSKITIHEASESMLWPMFFLTLGSIFLVFAWNPADYHSSWILKAFHLEKVIPVLHTAHWIIPMVLTLGAIASWVIGWYWYVKKKYPLAADNKWVTFANKQGYINEFNRIIFISGTERLSKILYQFDRSVVDGLTKLFTGLIRQLSKTAHWFDKNIIDGFVNSVANSTYYLGHLVRHVQNGQLQGYFGFALTIVILGILYLLIK